MIGGQVNLYDAIRRQVDFKQGSKEYKLRTDRTLPTLIARARGWHLEEKHFVIDGEPISGSLFDFGLYFYHNAKELVARGTGPYYYLPKMESHLEARLWNDVFNLSQDYIGIPRGTIRGTVLIETITAAFEMDEIIYELRDHSSGLNCGRWDYIFSFIKLSRTARRRDLIVQQAGQELGILLASHLGSKVSCSQLELVTARALGSQVFSLLLQQTQGVRLVDLLAVRRRGVVARPLPQLATRHFGRSSILLFRVSPATRKVRTVCGRKDSP